MRLTQGSPDPQHDASRTSSSCQGIPGSIQVQTPQVPGRDKLVEAQMMAGSCCEGGEEQDKGGRPLLLPALF